MFVTKITDFPSVSYHPTDPNFKIFARYLSLSESVISYQFFITYNLHKSYLLCQLGPAGSSIPWIYICVWVECLKSNANSWLLLLLFQPCICAHWVSFMLFRSFGCELKHTHTHFFCLCACASFISFIHKIHHTHLPHIARESNLLLTYPTWTVEDKCTKKAFDALSIQWWIFFLLLYYPPHHFSFIHLLHLSHKY